MATVESGDSKGGSRKLGDLCGFLTDFLVRCDLALPPGGMQLRLETDKDEPVTGSTQGGGSLVTCTFPSFQNTAALDKTTTGPF